MKSEDEYCPKCHMLLKPDKHGYQWCKCPKVKETMVLRCTQPVSEATMERIRDQLEKVEARSGIQFIVLDEGFEVLVAPEGMTVANLPSSMQKESTPFSLNTERKSQTTFVDAISRLNEAFKGLRRIWGTDGELVYDADAKKQAPSYFDYQHERTMKEK